MHEFDAANTITIATSSAKGSERVFKPGDIVGGSYRLKKLLGRGGMGYVFLAEHTMFSKDYALKLISSGRLTESSRNRFELEGRIIAKLNHPNIVKVHNMGFDDGCPFYVMDLLQGRTLDELIGEEVSVSRWLDIFTGLAAGLSYAHSKNIIHRDIKPSNVAMTGDDLTAVPKLLDFGIAKSTEGNSQQSLTMQGEIIGSPLYMSTEQSMGVPVDLRTDIYSLGCTFFECLADIPPFKGTSAVHTLMLHQQEAVPELRSLKPAMEYAAELDLLIHKMMAKNRDQRYQTMNEVTHDIDRIKRGLPIGKRGATAASTVNQVDSVRTVATNGKKIDRDRKISTENNDTDDDVPKSNLAVPLSVMLALTTLAVSAAGLLVISSQQAEVPSQSKAPLVVPIDDKLSATVVSNINTLAFQRERSNKAAAIADYIDAQPINAIKTVRNGVQQFKVRFPAWSIGQVVQPAGPSLDARETQYFANVDSLGLVSGGHDSRQIFNYPDIFKKIDPRLFTGFAVNGRCLSDGAANYDNLIDESLSVENILKTVSDWPRLERCSVAKVLLTVGSAHAVSSMYKLQHLSLIHCQINTSEMSRLPMWKRLRSIEFRELDTLEPIIDAFSTSQKLEIVKILNCNLTDRSFTQICAVENLDSLHIKDKNVALLLPHLKSARKLTHLNLSDVKLTLSQLGEILAAPKLKLITVDDDRYSPAEKSEMMAETSKIRFYKP